ncbi:MAG: DNA repair protein RadA [bacterium]
MATPKTTYICQQCGSTSPRWLGKCPDCQSWNSFVETLTQKQPKGLGQRTTTSSKTPSLLSQITASKVERIPTPFDEFNRVTGGGIVPGSIILIGGEPGIGKSTILLQIAASLSLSVLYISAEESLEQIKLRADRMNVTGNNLSFLSSTNLEEILETIREYQPKLVIMDSIQTIYSMNMQGTPGSVGQVRECAQQLTNLGKEFHIPIMLVGHITKEGIIAGPKTLEHLVDVVLYFEGEQTSQFRVLRGIKNRFGAIDEIGLFQMSDQGLMEVKNPSQLFLPESQQAKAGSVIVATIEGTRPLLVEIQALTSKTSFGYPKRTTAGIDLNRLSLLTAVLGKKTGVFLENQDIYINVTGGLTIKEPAADLGIALAVYSSFSNKPLTQKLAVFGEIGLSGELRPVHHNLQRLQEIQRLGFETAIIPKPATPTKPFPNLKIYEVTNLQQALEIIR